MSDLETIELKKLPALGPQMMGALLSRKPGLARGEELPLISNRIGSVALDSARLGRMRSLCQIPDGSCLPPTALHILAAPLHIALLTDKRVPIKAMGIVHASNQIRCLSPVPEGASIEMGCRIGETRWKPKGLEFDLLTEALLDGEPVWEEVTTIFSRVSDEVAREAGRERKPSAPTPEWSDAETTRWELPSNLGRAYGGIAGDRNPIHLYGWTAKPFGFSRPIIHGMYLLARALGEMECSGERTENSIVFKRPVPLPGVVRMQRRTVEQRTEFRLLREGADKVLLSGQMRSLVAT
jgi:acyl dehydratase